VVERRRERYVVRQLDALARKSASLADEYSGLQSALEGIGISRARVPHAAATLFLREQSHKLRQTARLMTARRPSEFAYRLRDLEEHLLVTTGGYRDLDVCRLLDIVTPRPKNDSWTCGMLQQLRARQKRWPKEMQIAK
jgi:hypothetical protein